jgi:hypothetical protein
MLPNALINLRGRDHVITSAKTSVIYGCRCEPVKNETKDFDGVAASGAGVTEGIFSERLVGSIRQKGHTKEGWRSQRIRAFFWRTGSCQCQRQSCRLSASDQQRLMQLRTASTIGPAAFTASRSRASVQRSSFVQ